MKNDKINGFCHSCGDEIQGKLSNLLRICTKCSTKTARLKPNQVLSLSGTKHKGWS